MSFVQKPAQGWHHSEADLTSGQGVAYVGKYLGSIRMDKSMRTIDFDARTEVTREAIKLVREESGVIPRERRKVSQLVRQCITADPVVRNWDVMLYVSTAGLSVVIRDTGNIVANHIMPCISFATGADAHHYTAIGYVAKDERDVRECHVFDLGQRAPDSIVTIGQAFELRFKAFLQKGQQQQQMRQQAQPAIYGDSSSVVVGTQQQQPQKNGQYDDIIPETDAYGDLGYPQMEDPLSMYGDNEPSQSYSNTSTDPLYDNPPQSQQQGGMRTISEEPAYDTATDIVSEPQYDRANTGSGNNTVQYDTVNTGISSEPQYDRASNNRREIVMEAQYDHATDFDDEEGEDYEESFDDDTPVKKAPSSKEFDRDIHVENWFHGQLSRTAADAQLAQSGDFLVRESMHTRGQYILSAMQNGNVKHLLLVDPSGLVRTRDMSFDSVPHLINYHLKTNLPIISRGSRVVLGQPVERVSESYSSFALKY